jgi:hypothetical protein
MQMEMDDDEDSKAYSLAKLHFDRAVRFCGAAFRLRWFGVECSRSVRPDMSIPTELLHTGEGGEGVSEEPLLVSEE